MLINTFLAFLCLVKAKRDEIDDPDFKIPEKERITKKEKSDKSEVEVDPMTEPNFYIDQLKALKEQESRGLKSISPWLYPVIFDNEDTDGNWTALTTNSTGTSGQTCSYVEQADGSVLINTMHRYLNNDNCHQYWECENPKHNMFFKWNRADIEGCPFDWTRFAWGTEKDEKEVICSSEGLERDQKFYKNTGTNKIVWDFQADSSVQRWGVEAQILCQDPSDVNECVDGSHKCHESAECIKEPGIGCK